LADGSSDVGSASDVGGDAANGGVGVAALLLLLSSRVRSSQPAATLAAAALDDDDDADIAVDGDCDACIKVSLSFVCR